VKVLLISANTVVEPYPVYPLGLDYVAGALAADHEVQCLDMNCFPDEGLLLPAIMRFNPDIIGISLRNIDNTDALHPQSYIPDYQHLIRCIRQVSAVPIVLGGSGFTIYPNELMDLLEADFGVVGEGERIVLLLAALQKGEDPPWSREVVRNLSFQADQIGFYLKNGGMLNLQTKRGCPFRCVYCSYPHIEGRTMRYRNPDQIASDAVALQQAGAKYLFLTDSAFNAHIDHSLSVAKAFKSAGLTIPWGGFFAPTRMPEGYFDTLADCGLKHVEFGTEALCDSVLQAYGKPFFVEQVLKVHRAANAAGLYVAHYFLFAGPGENEQTLSTTLSNIDKLEKTVLFLFCGMRIYPHTALYEIAKQQGQLKASQSILEPVFYRSPTISIPRAAEMIAAHAHGRENWVQGAGGEETGDILNRMYRKGFTGPLWEYLIR
jgi:radical SAM superfamily enzyme YgiQ (UPF0313 family)